MVTVHAPAWTRVVVCTGTPDNAPNNESMVTVHVPAWTRVVVCAGTANIASMVTVYAPAWTTAVVCAGTPHNKLRVTIHAPAWKKVVVCVDTQSVIICDVYRRRTRVSRRLLCCVHRHVICVVIRTHLDTRFFPVGGEEGRHASARWRRRRSMHRHTCHSTSTPH